MQKHLSKLKGFYKYLVVSILLAIPLFPKFPLIKIFGTFVAIRLEDFLLLLTSMVWLVLSLPSIKNIIKGNISKAIIIYLAIGLTSTCFGIIILRSVSPSIGILHWVRRIEYFMAFFIGMFAVKNNLKDINFYFKLIPLVVILVFLYGYGQKHFGWPIIITQNMEYSKGVALRWIPGSHINSTFAGHYDLSSYLVFVMPFIVLGYFLIKGFINKLIFAVSFFSGLWLMVNAASRISLLSYFISVTLALLLVKKYKAIIIVGIITIIFVGFSSNLISRYLRVIDVVKERYLSISMSMDIYAADNLTILRKENIAPTPTPIPVFEDRSTSIRLNVEWPRALRALLKNPLLGTGLSSITLATDNDYLRLLGETGLLGFFSFILILVRLSITFIRKLSVRERFDNTELVYLCGFSCAIVGILLNAFFIDIFEASKFAISFWLIMGMLVQLVYSKEYEK